jgi:outer membrane protein OmpA-like peptidoglycan-associated protein
LLPPPAKPPVSRLRVDGATGSARLTLTPPGNMRTAAIGPPRLAPPSPPDSAARRTAPPPKPATARPAPLASSTTSAPPPPPKMAAAPLPEPAAVAKPAPDAAVAPPPPVRAEPTPEPVQTAQLPAAGAAIESGRALRIRFAANASKLPDSARADLKSLAARLDKDSGARLQLLAYASGSAETASRARRTSLARALAVRSFLIDQGVRSTRIDVRALGTNAEGGPADRVDVNIVKR